MSDSKQEKAIAPVAMYAFKRFNCRMKIASTANAASRDQAAAVLKTHLPGHLVFVPGRVSGTCRGSRAERFPRPSG